MGDALIFARNHEFDVFNALNVMENEEFLKGLKFGIGDGHLQYYIYNWSTTEVIVHRELMYMHTYGASILLIG
jgi:glycylpeptide N-tetradecanoyltransferase